MSLVQSTAEDLIPLVAIAIWVYMLLDWYRHAKNRRYIWLFVILLGGVLGYIFFLFSRDRQP